MLELLDGCELPAAAWEPEVLALRVNDYSPTLLDQLCFTGRIGWGRLTLPEIRTVRSVGPVRSSPISLFARQNLPHWLALSGARFPRNFRRMRNRRSSLVPSRCAVFRRDCQTKHLLPSRVEQALAELAAQGYVTADGFEGCARCFCRKTNVRRSAAPAAQTSQERHKCGIWRTMVAAAKDAS